MMYGCIGLCKYVKGIRPMHEAIELFKEDIEEFVEGREGVEEAESKALPLLEGRGK